jgi:hypothetical protein
VTGLTAGPLLLLAALAAMPLIAGRSIPAGPVEAGALALVVFVLLFAVCAVLVVSAAGVPAAAAAVAT